MSVIFRFMGVACLGIIAAAACGDVKGNGDGSGPDKGGTSAGSGGSGDTISVPGPGGSGPVVDEGPPPSGGVFEDPPLTACSAPNDCCEALGGCNDGAEYVCTVDGYCGLIKGSCSEQKDCQADTSCCIGDECLGNTTDPGVCIPANVPTNQKCSESVELGVFAPSVQCEWLGPTPSEPEPNSKNVSATPLVADLPIKSGEISDATPNGSSAEIVIITWDSGAHDGEPESGMAADDGSKHARGVIRIIDGQDCSLKASIVDKANWPRAIATPALADLDGDGDIEIIARRDAGGLVAYTYNDAKSAYEVMWVSSGGGYRIATEIDQAWDGPAVHDLNNDGKPEVLLREAVFNGQTGANITAGSGSNQPYNGLNPVVADFDQDGDVERFGVNGWDQTALFSWKGASWGVDKNVIGDLASQMALADFGTPGASAADFDPTTLDGVPEVVMVNDSNGNVNVVTLAGQTVMKVATSDRGGPPNIGDFDGDGFPEIGVAGGYYLRVFDFDCKVASSPGCSSTAYVRWSKPSQDYSSQQTGATIFDFDGDGSAEVVYADECFLRVYSGTDGTVVFSSYRTSNTWFESPLVADVDKDQNTEIVVNNSKPANSLCSAGADAIHPGIACDSDAECPESSTCGDGYCRCSTDADCQGSGNVVSSGLSCAAAVAPATGGKVCRATHPGAAASATGIRVLRDTLDRWASSRSIWNQMSYSITNVNDDGSIPKTSDWKPNWKEPGLNNYRQNVQGEAGFEDLPDITGRFADEEACVTASNSSKVYVQATVCNRGKRAVGSALPATFYKGDPSNNDILCTSYTDGPVPTGGCKLVYCAISGDIAGETLTLQVNDDGKGGRSTVECTPDNNSDSTMVDSCAVEVIR